MGREKGKHMYLTRIREGGLRPEVRGACWHNSMPAVLQKCNCTLLGDNEPRGPSSLYTLEAPYLSEQQT